MKAESLTGRLVTRKRLVSDGAWGTMLQARGLRPGECPELWCLTRRADVMDVARAYVAAGADMIKTNSFGANRFKLAFYGLSDRAGELSEAAAAISREAAGDRIVLGSMGPTGLILMMGDVPEADIYAAFREQAAGLMHGGADVCLVETMSAADEAALAVRAAREATDLEVACTFTFQRTQTGEHRTMMGLSPADAARAAVEAGAHVVGANCGQGMAEMAEIVAEMRTAVPGHPILVHANAGLPHNVNGVDVFPETPEIMAARVREVLRAGAVIVGGCCGTTPDHVSAMAKVVRAFEG